jgi:hypothetical protein
MVTTDNDRIEDGPHYVVAVRPEVLLRVEGDDAPPSDGLAVFSGYLAGPFVGFGQAEDALDRCEGLLGEVLGIYSEASSSICFREGSL